MVGVKYRWRFVGMYALLALTAVAVAVLTFVVVTRPTPARRPAVKPVAHVLSLREAAAAMVKLYGNPVSVEPVAQIDAQTLMYCAKWQTDDYQAGLCYPGPAQ